MGSPASVPTLPASCSKFPSVQTSLLVQHSVVLPRPHVALCALHGPLALASVMPTAASRQPMAVPIRPMSTPRRDCPEARVRVNRSQRPWSFSMLLVRTANRRDVDQVILMLRHGFGSWTSLWTVEVIGPSIERQILGSPATHPSPT